MLTRYFVIGNIKLLVKQGLTFLGEYGCNLQSIPLGSPHQCNRGAPALLAWLVQSTCAAAE